MMATPAQVDAAYERRMRQYINLEDTNDYDTNIRKICNLYDAHVLMSHKPSRQWIAQMRLKTTTELTKLSRLLYIKCKLLSEVSDLPAKWILEDIMTLSRRMEKCHRQLRAFIIMDAMCLGAFLSSANTNTEFWIKACILGIASLCSFGIGYKMTEVKQINNTIKIMTGVLRKYSELSNAMQHTK